MTRLVLLAALAVAACGQPAPPAVSPAQKPSPSPVASRAPDRPVTQADIDFMTGMIGHHTQAVMISGWAPSHGASASIQRLASRIVAGQKDEIIWMQNWLRDHNQPVPSADSSHAHMMMTMPGMDHGQPMAGMLNAEQLAALDKARGPAFDRLFLTGMIQHHTGALTMVKQLLAVPGAAQDDQVFKIVSDMNADQTTEIDRMNTMLDALPPSALTE